MGNFSGDDFLGNLLEEGIRVGIDRIREINQGFNSARFYDVGTLRRAAADERRTVMFIESPTTHTRYGVVLLPDTLTEVCVHAIQVAMNDQLLPKENYRMMTLSRAATGVIHLKIGWC